MAAHTGSYSGVTSCRGSRRRPDRRRRPVRHRRRVPPARSVPGQDASRSSRRAMPSAAPGTCSGIPASGPTPTCSRSATRSGRGRRPRRSPTGPRSVTYVRETAASTASTARSASGTASCARRWSTRGRALDRRGGAHRHRRDRALTCNFLLGCTGYYRYDEGYTPEFEGVERFQGADRPPAALARGPRLRRQARRRHRQRRDRRDARSRDGRARRARDDAAALAVVRRVAARPGPARATLLRRMLPAEASRIAIVTLEERAAAHGRLPV